MANSPSNLPALVQQEMERERLTGGGRLFAVLIDEPNDLYPYKPPKDLIYKFLNGQPCDERVPLAMQTWLSRSRAQAKIVALPQRGGRTRKQTADVAVAVAGDISHDSVHFSEIEPCSRACTFFNYFSLCVCVCLSLSLSPYIINS